MPLNEQKAEELRAAVNELANSARDNGDPEAVVEPKRKALLAVIDRLSADSVGAEPVESEQSIAADSYWNIAETLGTLDGYSVQEHAQIMKEVMEQCSDFLHDFVGTAEGGDDEAVRLAANVRNCLSGRIDLVEVE